MDDLGNRMKKYEAMEAGRRFMPLLPLYARLDGRNFSTLTKGLDRPFDKRFSWCMVELTRFLMEETGALAGYTQSDEISLLWYRPNPKSDLYFDGKIFKIQSVTAAMAASKFTLLAQSHWPGRVGSKPVAFDCRAFQLPNKDEATNVFLWRELDATKNAVSMAARGYFSHKDLHGKTGPEMQEMMFQKAGVNFNDFPARFKRGTFLIRRIILKSLDADTLAKIPEGKRPGGPIERQIIEEVAMPRFRTVTNRVEVLFDGVPPIC